MQPFCMSGAVSGHQSARQRQAEQIISRDEGGGEGRASEAGGEGERESGSAGKAPRRRVFNIRLERLAQTGRALLSQANVALPPPPPSFPGRLASHQPRHRPPSTPVDNLTDGGCGRIKTLAFLHQPSGSEADRWAATR